MFILKHFKNAPTCFDLIQIILRELVYSLLKSLILKCFKNVKFSVVMRQHNIWCVYVRSIERTYTHLMLWCRITILNFTFLANFKISDFNKEYTSSLRMI